MPDRPAGLFRVILETDRMVDDSIVNEVSKLLGEFSRIKLAPLFHHRKRPVADDKHRI